MNTNADDLSWFWKRKFLKQAILGALACVILVYIFTTPWIIPPLHESEVIVYVPLTILSQQLNQQGIGFASDREIDWYIQILKSNQMTDSLIKNYNLASYFKIDTTELDAKNQLYKEMESRIIIHKTRYGSVSIRVRDNNASRAAEMANDIISIGERIKTNLLFPNRLESMRYVTSLYEQKSKEVARLEQSLDSLMETTPGIKKDYMYNKIITLFNREYQELITRKGVYERELKNFDTPLPTAYIISSAVPKSEAISPKRTLLMAAAGGIYLLFLVVFEIFRYDNRKVA